MMVVKACEEEETPSKTLLVRPDKTAAAANKKDDTGLEQDTKRVCLYVVC